MKCTLNIDEYEAILRKYYPNETVEVDLFLDRYTTHQFVYTFIDLKAYIHSNYELFVIELHDAEEQKEREMKVELLQEALDV